MNKYLLLLITMVLSACQGPSLNPEQSATETFAPTETLTPSETPSRTETPSPTFTPTLVPSFTPLPRLSTDEAIKLVKELMRTNGGCELPCWWGITPGVSKWPETRQFLETFAIEIEENSVEPGRQFLTFGYPEAAYGIIQEFLFVNKDGIIELIWASMENIGSIKSLLAKFGPPPEVWVYSNGFGMGVPSNNKLVFSYPEKGIMVELYGIGYLRNQKNGIDYLSFCATEFENFASLSLWRPDPSVSFIDIAKKWFVAGLDRSWKFKRIRMVAGFSEEEFYNLFSTNPYACFETRNDFWY